MSKKSDFALKLETDIPKKTFKEWHPSKNRMKGHSWPTGTIFGLNQENMYELKENNRWRKCKPTKNTEKKTTKKKNTKKKNTKKKTTKKKNTKKKTTKKKTTKKKKAKLTKGDKKFSDFLEQLTPEKALKAGLKFSY